MGKGKGMGREGLGRDFCFEGRRGGEALVPPFCLARFHYHGIIAVDPNKNL